MGSIEENETLENIEKKIALYPGFPKQGILFRDIMPILADHSTYDSMIEVLCNRVQQFNFDLILGIESRGFLIGPLMAHKLKLPFCPIRKKGKLPGEVYSVSYELEYGKDVLEVQKNTLNQDSRCLIVDDLIASGGSLEAAKKLIELSGSSVAAFAVVVELKALDGRKRIGDKPLVTLFTY